MTEMSTAETANGTSSGGAETFIAVFQASIIAVISAVVIVSNIVNLIVLVSASNAMSWPTRIFLINLSSSDLLVGLVVCAPAVLSAAKDTWRYGDVWCNVSGIAYCVSCTLSIWSIAMVGLQRYGREIFFRLQGGPRKSKPLVNCH